MAPSTRVVWMWFQLRADPEGFVCASVAGVAIGANVTLEAAHIAIEELTEQDDDAEPVQILEKVPRGWRLVGFEQQRELAKSEAQKARNRKYMAKYRAAKQEPANDADVDALLAISTEPPLPSTVDAPKPKPKPKPSPEVEILETRAGEAVTRVLPPRVINRIPADWQPTEELRQAATMAGVLRFDEQLASLRTGPVGGARGIFEDGIDNYIQGLFGTWRAWEETQRAKAANAAKPRGQSYRKDEPAAELVDFDPRYLDTNHSDFCDRARLGAVEPLAREWRALAVKEGKPLTRLEADKAFAKWLGKRAKAQKSRAA
jgi:hypothetical protein